ncbi:MAG: hypothetical protein JGK21_05815 [Microcoleus sp. PH2017_22_RUC_O_B]|nr:MULTISPECIES: hypothetical protein [unclassified Microcoleus]MCC3527828.1 hypothetical protein [Microcoleus sp. PH2017_21_RUC_O_A]MCC3539900.1 hypothetical protein [Microcoleus sp. PH2017_22_RUC_O_B]
MQIPKSLHRNLADRAEREGMSIEQHILAVLSTVNMCFKNRI